jgi:hypothetical protein
MTQKHHNPFGMLSDRRGQSVVWGFLCMLIFIAVSAGLIDIYRLYAARNWAYSVAQEAALSGVSRGRDWSSVSAGGKMRLDALSAHSEAQNLVIAEMTVRGLNRYVVDVRVLPDPNGGSISGYPPNPVRLGPSLANWSSSEPAVGVYLEVPVDWLVLDVLGSQPKSVRVFAAAGVGQ